MTTVEFSKLDYTNAEDARILVEFSMPMPATRWVVVNP